MQFVDVFLKFFYQYVFFKEENSGLNTQTEFNKVYRFYSLQPSQKMHNFLQKDIAGRKRRRRTSRWF